MTQDTSLLFKSCLVFSFREFCFDINNAEPKSVQELILVMTESDLEQCVVGCRAHQWWWGFCWAQGELLLLISLA